MAVVGSALPDENRVKAQEANSWVSISNSTCSNMNKVSITLANKLNKLVLEFGDDVVYADGSVIYYTFMDG